MKSLYTYFGLLDLHSTDTPGHNLYQLGLIDSIANEYGQEKFDFFSYYPEDLMPDRKSGLIGFPNCLHGKIFMKYFEKRIDKYLIGSAEMFSNVSEKKYDKLFLKARFRNLSTLSKKWKDARTFELLIITAIEAGYSKEEIIILDTDLSLSEHFTTKYEEFVTIVIPSIDFPGISSDFLEDCVATNIENWDEKHDGLCTVYYGNINTSNYKNGNQKNEILGDAIRHIEKMNDGKEDALSLICKREDYEGAVLHPDVNRNLHIERYDRHIIFGTLLASNIMLNVTKDKYNDNRFIPARIYEAIIFGLIPVSYKFEFMSTAFSFNSIEDLEEIYLYFKECSKEDMLTNYKAFIKSFIKAKPFTNNN